MSKGAPGLLFIKAPPYKIWKGRPNRPLQSSLVMFFENIIKQNFKKIKISAKKADRNTSFPSLSPRNVRKSRNITKFLRKPLTFSKKHSIIEKIKESGRGAVRKSIFRSRGKESGEKGCIAEVEEIFPCFFRWSV
jgi:hypothetical protein